MGRPGGDDADWLEFEEALRAVLERAVPIGDEEVAVADAGGRALAEEVRSRVDHPPWDNSAMDGFAVRAPDVEGASPERPVSLPVAGEVHAGDPADAPLEPGTAVRVATGAPVPEGTTGVVRVEHTDGGSGGRVEIRRDDDARGNVRERGEDVERGQLLLSAGEELDPAAIGVLAMSGVERVRVGRRPRVGILATGEELAGPDEHEAALAGEKLFDSNSPALAAMVLATGGLPVRLAAAGDDPEAVRDALASAGECDLLVTTGGVSVGERDPVKAALASLGAERVFWRIRIRPGSPVVLALLPDGRPVLGLPGNPVSAVVTGEVLLRPAIRRMAGHAAVRRRGWRARLAETVSSVPDLTYFYRVTLEEADGDLP
ncbi:MAG TPA: gephyrin-like molybdotransferase Glp, partial [Longimicrobiales bacterium]|nr:gephyrin-like molybdotransferase Glp [Longimicrobiales bacterium]